MLLALIIIVPFLLLRIEFCHGIALFDTLHVLYEKATEGIAKGEHKHRTIMLFVADRMIPRLLPAEHRPGRMGKEEMRMTCCPILLV
jgi:hypothetical protein